MQLTIECHGYTLLETASACLALTRTLDVLLAVFAELGLALAFGHRFVGGLCIARPARGLCLRTLDVGAHKEHTGYRCSVNQDDLHRTFFAHTNFFATNKLAERTAFDADTLVAATATRKGIGEAVFDTVKQGKGGVVVGLTKQGQIITHFRSPITYLR